MRCFLKHYIVHRNDRCAMKIEFNPLIFHGNGLVRPECVVAHRSGWLFAPCCDGMGGISAVSPSGETRHHLAQRLCDGAPDSLFPNGIALEDGGSFLIAHLGQSDGGVYRLSPDGTVSMVTNTADGAPMPPTNYAVPDSQQRVWITVSTTLSPRARDYRPDAATGYIALHEDGQTRIVADGLGYTNECLLSADEKTLWVNETFGRRLTAFDVTADGLTNRRTVVELGAGTFPDGLTEAADGSLFVASIVSNRVLRIWPDGQVETLIEDVDAGHLARVETAFQAHEMDRPHLDSVRSERLQNTSNIAFGGPDLKTAYLGCLLGDSIASFDAPVAGRALPHWNHDISPLLNSLGVAS